jgi:uncharacterized protein YraI
MKLLSWLLSALAPLGAATVLAQSLTPASPPQTPPSAASAPELAPQSQPTDTKKKTSAFKEEHLFDPPATAGVKDALNVRGQPALKGEVVAHLHKGDTVSVLESLILRKPRKNEPANWARISLPSDTPVWVFADYIDPKSMTVLPNRVNLRGGPGENFSVLGRLDKGASVKEIARRNGWVQIETPAGAYGFVDADYLEIKASPAPAVVESTPAPATAPTPQPAAAPAPTAPEPAKPAAIVAPEPTAASPPPKEPAPAAVVSPPNPRITERIISREGVLRRAYNIQAPADYELRNISTGEVIDFIQPQPKQDLKSYIGARVIVSGVEVLYYRWPKTPILELQSLDRVP